MADAYNVLRVEGHEFPPASTVPTATFAVEVAPEWAEGTRCYTCRTEFGFVTRKHHCRACGQIFCHKCSSKTAAVPKFGIEKPVRVCDRCELELSGQVPPTAAGGLGSNLGAVAAVPGAAMSGALSPEEEVARAIAANPSLAAVAAKPVDPRREQELKEQEELDLVMALSMSEAEGGRRSSQPAQPAQPAPGAWPSAQDWGNGVSASAPSPSPMPSRTSSSVYAFDELDSLEGDDPMGKYLARARGGSSSAPPPQPQQPQQPVAPAASAVEPRLVAEVPALPLATPADAEFLDAMEKGLEMFESKLQKAARRGTRGDASMRALFRSLAMMHTELIARTEAVEDDKATHLAMREKHANIAGARRCMEEMRTQQASRLQAQRAEQEMLEKLQLEQKMKLIEQQRREQEEHTARMAEQARIAELEERRLAEERALAMQQAALEQEHRRLAEQRAELEQRQQAAATSLEAHRSQLRDMSAQRLDRLDGSWPAGAAQAPGPMAPPARMPPMAPAHHPSPVQQQGGWQPPAAAAHAQPMAPEHHPSPAQQQGGWQRGPAAGHAQPPPPRVADPFSPPPAPTGRELGLPAVPTMAPQAARPAAVGNLISLD